MGKAAKRKREARAAGPPATTAGAATAATAATAGATGPSRVPRWVLPAVAGAITAAFLILKCYAVHAHRSDEGIYFYDALRISQGARLYRDLFFAHPPLHLLVPALLTWLAGYSFPLLKSLPQLAAAVEGGLVFLIARRVFKSDVAAVVAAGALWFSNDFLKASSYLTGINQGDALLYGALLALLHRRSLLAGALAAAAVMTLIQTAPVVLGMAGAALYFDRRLGLRFAAAVAAGVVLVNLGGALYAGRAFFDQVYFYHLNKTGDGGMHQLSLLIADDLTVFFGGGVALLLFALEPRPAVRQFLQAASAVALLHVVAITTRPVVFPFYFQPLFPLLTLGLGWGVAAGVERLRARRWAVGVALTAGLLLGPGILESPLTSLVSSTRAEQRRTYTQRYTWRDAPLLGPLNSVVRALLFADGRRNVNTWYLGATEYLWNQSRTFESLPAIVEEVRAATAGDDAATLFGDSTSLPLVALASGHRIALDFADTNAQRFTSRTTTPADAIAQLETAPPRLVLTAGGGFFRFPEFQRWVADHYRERRSFSDGDGTRYTLHERR